MSLLQFTVSLEPECLTLISLNRGAESGREKRILYLKSLPMRDAVRALVNTLIENLSTELFSDLCVRCGNCCLNRTIPVTSRSIEKYAHFLRCYDEELFRSEYIEKAHTWNDRDGILARRNSSCVFLEKVSAHGWRCRIYPLRPTQCVSIPTASDKCKKDRGALICHIEEIQIFSETVEVKRTGEHIYSFPVDLPFLKPVVVNLLSLLAPLVESERSIPEDKIGSVRAMVTAARKLFYQAGLTLELQDEIGRVVDALEQLKEEISGVADALEQPEESEAGSGRDPSAGLAVQIDGITAEVMQLMDCITEETERSSGIEPVERLLLSSECMQVTLNFVTVRIHRVLIYRDYPSLLNLVRKLLHRIVSCRVPAIMSSLIDNDAECIRCGECCMSFTGEISPIELDRIAAHLETSVEDMWNTILEAGVASWNEQMAIFKGIPVCHKLPADNSEDSGSSEGSHPSLDLPVPSVQCPFLERLDDGFCHCSIYEVRPSTCRHSDAHSPPCRNTIPFKRPDLCIDKIISIDLQRDILYIATELSEKRQQEPAPIYLREHRKQFTLVEELKHEVQRIINSQQQSLER